VKALLRAHGGYTKEELAHLAQYEQGTRSLIGRQAILIAIGKCAVRDFFPHFLAMYLSHYKKKSEHKKEEKQRQRLTPQLDVLLCLALSLKCLDGRQTRDENLKHSYAA
jgi:hypothetical protein